MAPAAGVVGHRLEAVIHRLRREVVQRDHAADEVRKRTRDLGILHVRVKLLPIDVEVVNRRMEGPLHLSDIAAEIDPAAARRDLVRLETRYASVGADDSLIVRPTDFPAERKVLFCTGFSPQRKPVLLDQLTGRRAKSSTAPPGP